MGSRLATLFYFYSFQFCAFHFNTVHFNLSKKYGVFIAAIAMDYINSSQ